MSGFNPQMFTFYYMNKKTKKHDFCHAIYQFQKYFEDEFLFTEIVDHKEIPEVWNVNALDEFGIPYYTRINAMSVKKAKEYWQKMHPNHTLWGIDLYVDNSKPMMY